MESRTGCGASRSSTSKMWEATGTPLTTYSLAFPVLTRSPEPSSPRRFKLGLSA
ncbi:unnamed protein product [Symbiodinium pilosum]|uniref:Uncharacterized protein n=1 Tax=Symbiodinium pilosum TaxID=2952 RepID=A0A812IUE7_SYMPI|nr:unnamed protein product [Symbiodinium pilosum]